MNNLNLNNIRLDQLLIKLGYARSRERAKDLIKAGSVLIDGKPITKVATLCNEKAKIQVTVKDIEWVSRAGLKLEKAFDVWKIKVADLVCLDIGASTGGFTEVLLKAGARKVYALDVGHGQLAQKLKDDERVVNWEGKNIREVEKDYFDEQIDFICTDVSFISLKLVLPKVAELLKNGGQSVVLIKPQFEVGKDNINKGVVRDSNLHKIVVEEIENLAIDLGFEPSDIIDSPIKGGSGNKEFLVYLKKIEKI